MDDPISGIGGVLAKVAERAKVYAFSYPSGEAALPDYEAAKALVLADDPRDDSGASVWRMTSGDGVWLVAVCDDCGLRERVAWTGEEYALDDELQAMLLERHLAQMVNAYDPKTGGSEFLARYNAGAELHRGGIAVPRVFGE